MRKLGYNNYYKICKRCEKHYKGSKYSKICSNCDKSTHSENYRNKIKKM